MRRLLCSFLVFASACPTAFADESPLSRRDGFLLIWNAIRRPAAAVKETPFTDVKDGDRGFLEIRYAKARGLLDDDSPAFMPDAELTMQDALLWLYRTRNIDDIDLLTRENLPELVGRYPVGDVLEGERGARVVTNRTVTKSELEMMMRMLDALLVKEDHEVSLYAEKFHGKGTAFGETFDMHAMTAAHRTFPHNTLVKVTNISNGKTIIVRINDRGPYVKGRDMDLSLAAFTALEARSKGKFRATFERLGDASLVETPAQTVALAAASAQLSSCEIESPIQTRAIGRLRLADGVPRQWPVGKELSLTARSAFAVGMVQNGGERTTVNRTVQPGETYTFTPPSKGLYRFQIGVPGGRSRWIVMKAVDCPS